MQKIAFERFSLWSSEAWNEYKSGFTNLLPWGALVFGLILIQQMLSAPMQFIGMASPEIMGVLIVLVTVLGFIIQGGSQVLLCGIGLARWHGREATIEDVKQDVNTYVQGVLAFLLMSICIALVLMIGLIPGVGILVAGVMNEDTALMVIGGGLMLLLGLPCMMLGQALTYFTIPLVVEKKLDFWSAILQSLDCVRRDLLGMAVFALVYTLLYGLTTSCTCGFGVIFLAPFFGVLQMRAYRDYFGLEADQIAPRIAGIKSTRPQPNQPPMMYPQAPPPSPYPQTPPANPSDPARPLGFGSPGQQTPPAPHLPPPSGVVPPPPLPGQPSPQEAPPPEQPRQDDPPGGFPPPDR